MVLTLQELEGKSVKEISSLTGWSTSLVKVRAFRARTQLKKLLKQTMLERFY
jgi:RNA polymerase sigma-70 factor (ECF subfamily)